MAQQFSLTDEQFETIRDAAASIKDMAQTEEVFEAGDEIASTLAQIAPTREDVVTREEYQNHIELLADEVEASVQEYDEEPGEAVWEAADSSSFVIYTHKAKKALEHSQNEPDEWKNLVADDDSWADVLQSMAYTVVRQDVYDELHERGNIEF